MVEGEVFLKVDVEADFLLLFALSGWDDFEDAATDEVEEEFAGGDAVTLLFGFGFVTAFDEVAEGLAAVFVLTGEDVKNKGEGDFEGGREGFWRRALQLLEGLFIPVNVAFLGRRFFDDFFLFAGGGFGFEFEVFDDVFGGLRDDVTDVVEATSSGASGNLLEVAHREDAGAFAVVFTHLGEDDCSDGDVDSDAEGVGATDDFEESALGEFFDEESVFCLLYTSPSPRDQRGSRMPSSA